MGQKEDQLRNIFKQAGAKVTSGYLPFPKLIDITSSGYQEEIQYVYRNLGGVM